MLPAVEYPYQKSTNGQKPITSGYQNVCGIKVFSHRAPNEVGSRLLLAGFTLGLPLSAEQIERVFPRRAKRGNDACCKSDKHYERNRCSQRWRIPRLDFKQHR